LHKRYTPVEVVSHSAVGKSQLESISTRGCIVQHKRNRGQQHREHMVISLVVVICPCYDAAWTSLAARQSVTHRIPFTRGRGRRLACRCTGCGSTGTVYQPHIHNTPPTNRHDTPNGDTNEHREGHTQVSNKTSQMPATPTIVPVRLPEVTETICVDHNLC